MPANVAAFPPLLVGVGAVLALVVEVLVGAVRRVPLAGLPLIAALTVPVSLLGGVPVLSFALAAVSFSLLLAAEQTLRVGQWGLGHWGGQRDDEDQHTDTDVGLPSTLPPAFAVGVAGVLVAVVAPILLPSGLGLLERFGSGGSGDGDGGPLELSNPMLNLQRDLVQGSNDPLVQISTTDPSPDYLRLTVLDEFDGEAWRPSERDIPPTNQADEKLPTPPGLDNATPKQAYRSSMVATEDFESQWLPTQYPAIDVGVSGDWRYDSETVDIVGSDTTFTQAEVTSLEIDPDPESLVDAPLPPRGVERLGTELPDDMPDFIERTAEEVTEGATSDFERVVMLQRWFREDGGFEYTLDTSDGNGLEQLEVFLGDGPGSREGYCEQFATALALMARSLDIPARVAVGFLEPERLGPDRWVYSRRDLHAWPEIYFEGAGWTLFDPTPSARVRQVPEYTSGQLPSEQQTTGPTDLPTDTASNAPRDLRRDDLLTGTDTSETDSGINPIVPTSLAVVLLLVGLVTLPRLMRAHQRRRRLEGRLPEGAGVVEGAWSEVRANALDLDLDWDDGASLRRQAIALLAPLRGPRPGSARATGQGPDEAARRRSRRCPKERSAHASKRWSSPSSRLATPGGASARRRWPRPCGTPSRSSPPWWQRHHLRPGAGPRGCRPRCGGPVGSTTAARWTRPPRSASRCGSEAGCPTGSTGDQRGSEGVQRSPSRRRRQRSSKRSIMVPDGGWLLRPPRGLRRRCFLPPSRTRRPAEGSPAGWPGSAAAALPPLFHRVRVKNTEASITTNPTTPTHGVLVTAPAISSTMPTTNATTPTAMARRWC